MRVPSLVLPLILLLSGCREADHRPRPNILILSLCSVRQDSLPMYGARRNTMPALGDFLRGGVIFHSNFSSTSWLPALSWISEMPESDFQDAGYQTIGQDPSARLFFIPNHYTSTGLARTRQMIMDAGKKPFFLAVHIKYPHFPYMLSDPGGPVEEGALLSDDSRKLFRMYFRNPKRFPEKIPLMALLWGEGTSLDEQSAGVVNNPQLLGRWKRSRGYDKDLVLLREAYDSKLLRLDPLLADVLHLYGDKRLQENTVIIVMGDHGEAFMEHGHLIHGETVHDEEIRFPMMIHFPGAEKVPARHVKTQFFQGSVVELVRGLIQGRLNQDNAHLFGVAQDRAIFSKNCPGNLRSVRFDNHWKLILDMATRKSVLFDLDKDPGETRDVSPVYPDETARLEELLILNLDRTVPRSGDQCMSDPP